MNPIGADDDDDDDPVTRPRHTRTPPLTTKSSPHMGTRGPPQSPDPSSKPPLTRTPSSPPTGLSILKKDKRNSMLDTKTAFSHVDALIGLQSPTGDEEVGTRKDRTYRFSSFLLTPPRLLCLSPSRLLLTCSSELGE